MRIAHLLSGGVDSSVALKLLIDVGHEVTAFYIKIWLEDELSSLGSCPWEEDLRYCRETCKKLKVPLVVVNLQKEYHENVVAYALAEVKAGRTPNPDIHCNSTIKFGAFVDYVDSKKSVALHGRFDKVASGHYAALRERDGRTLLVRNPDPVKDQSYFLARLSAKQLKRCLFPLGTLTKQEVRALAKRWKLPAAARKDSQGICFLGKIPYEEFIKHHLGEKEGDFVDDKTGEVVGSHKGHWFYTIGQRQRINVPHGPWYVVRKDVRRNSVIISNDYRSPEKKRDEFELASVRWQSLPDIGKPLLCKLRHGPTLYECVVSKASGTNKQTGKGKTGKRGTIHVRIHGNDQGIAPGQYCVLYDEDEFVGSGVIV